MVISYISSGFISWEICIKKKNPLFAYREYMWLNEPISQPLEVCLGQGCSAHSH